MVKMTLLRRGARMRRNRINVLRRQEIAREEGAEWFVP